MGSAASPGGRRGVVPGAPTGVTTRLLYPRGMTFRYERWEKGICVPARGATTRGGGTSI